MSSRYGRYSPKTKGAWHHELGYVGSVKPGNFKEIEEGYAGLVPGSWTTLPPDFGYDVVTDWPYEVTDSEEPIVVAGVDTQKSKDGQTRIDIMLTSRPTTTLHCDKRSADALMRDIESRLRDF